MSLYNMVHGMNPAAGMLLGLAGFEKASDVGRFRDAYVELDGDEPLIAVYTRNGGGNREHWDDEADEGPECGCTGCTITYRLPSLPNYVRDVDDDFDSTYATVYFRPPDGAKEGLRMIALPESERPAAVWGDFMAALQKEPVDIPEDGTKGERTARALLLSLKDAT